MMENETNNENEKREIVQEQEDDMRKQRISTISYAIVGIVAGYISFLINRPLISFMLMLVIGYFTMLCIKKAAKIERELKWWLGNGIVVYIFLWLIVWTIFYNIRLFS